MSTSRYYHTATLLSNGKVLMAGGYGQSGYQASAELYGPAILVPGGCNLIQNGSFETGTFDKWNPILPYGGGSAQVGKNIYGIPATDGQFEVVFNAGDYPASAVLSQSFATIPGQTYAVRLDYRDNNVNNSQRLIVGFTGNANQTAVATTTYQTFTFVFTATASTSTLTLSDDPTNYTYSIDGLLDNVRVNAATPVADVSITKTASNPAPVTGSNETYTLTVTNNGPTDATGVVVTDTLPAGTTYVSSSTSAGGTSSAAGNPVTVTATFPTLACGASATVTIVATVDCNVSNGTIISNTATVTSTTPDPNGANNSSPAVTVTASNPAPTITCPADITVSNDAGKCSAVVTFAATAVDNCPGTTFSYAPASGSVFDKGTTTVTATATDAAGNTATCAFNVTVNDTENPVITCPADITVSNDAGKCSAVVTFAATAVDNCPGTTFSYAPASGSVFDKGTTTVTATATDAAGNTATCTFTVTVVDNENPTITCPANISRGTDANKCSAVVTYPAPIIGDNCPGTTFSYAPVSGSTFAKGTTMVKATATDAAGKTATCTFTVTVKDTQIPTITCPADITQSNDVGKCSAVVIIKPVFAEDNCDGTIPVNGERSDGKPLTDPYPVGTTTIHWLIQDSSGNWAESCYQKIIVLDKELPTIKCPADVTVGNDTGKCSASNVALGISKVGDNCAVATVTNDAPSEYAKGTTTVTWTVTDIHGNKATCQQTVTVQDREKPVITCPADKTVPQTTAYGTTVNFTVTATDNCPGVTVVSIPASGSVFPLGTTTVTSTATDASGNTSTCSFKVTVVAPKSVGDKITGGGTIIGNCGAKANFSLNPQIDNTGALKGKVSYNDTALTCKESLNSILITAVVMTGNSARVFGTATVNGQPVNFVVDVVDNGEPGSADTFSIQVSDGYYAAPQKITGGNIQFH